MSIQITNDQRAAADTAGDDIDGAYLDGIVDETGHSYQPKIDVYSTLSTDDRNKNKDSFRQTFSVLSRYFLPISQSFTNTNPNYPAIISETQVASVTVKSFIARQAIVYFNFSSYANSSNLAVGFLVKVNGVQVGSTLGYYFNSSSDHRSAGGTFMVTIPAGTTVLTGHLTLKQGIGSIILDGNDTITFTVFG